VGHTDTNGPWKKQRTEIDIEYLDMDPRQVQQPAAGRRTRGHCHGLGVQVMPACLFFVGLGDV
jgi:hypothetical protein